MSREMRLACPAYDAVGLAVPGIPGLEHFDHTGQAARAITNAMADYKVLHRERLRRQDDGAVEVIETERGPVIIGDGGDDDGGAEGAISLRYPPRHR